MPFSLIFSSYVPHVFFDECLYFNGYPLTVLRAGRDVAR